jgi:hypothetical protein
MEERNQIAAGSFYGVAGGVYEVIDGCWEVILMQFGALALLASLEQIRVI